MDAVTGLDKEVKIEEIVPSTISVEKVLIKRIAALGPRRLVTVEAILENGSRGITMFYESTGSNSDNAGEWFPISGVVGEDALVADTGMSSGWLIKSFLWVEAEDGFILWNETGNPADHKNLEKRLTFPDEPCDIRMLSKMIKEAVDKGDEEKTLPSMIFAVENPIDGHAIKLWNSLIRFDTSEYRSEEIKRLATIRVLQEKLEEMEKDGQPDMDAYNRVLNLIHELES